MSPNRLSFKHKGTEYLADLSSGVDLAIPLRTGKEGLTAWGVEPARIEPHREGGFTGSIREGAAVNFNDIAFNPHAHTTHTECLGHIRETSESVYAFPPPPLMMALLVSVEPEARDADRVVSRAQLEVLAAHKGVEALIIRTLPNNKAKKSFHYSGNNPPFLEASAAKWIRESGVEHLLIDLPSVDREQDGGALAAHKAFWGLPGAPRLQATITEFVFVPDSVPDGLYLLNLQMAAFENDACPSRPVVFPISPNTN